jgi:hypothetical protein
MRASEAVVLVLIAVVVILMLDLWAKQQRINREIKTLLAVLSSGQTLRPIVSGFSGGTIAA